MRHVPALPSGGRSCAAALALAVVLALSLGMAWPGPLTGPDRGSVASAIPGAGAPLIGELDAASIASAAVHPTGSAVPTWVNVTHLGNQTAPAQGYAESVAYDAADHATILYGGCLTGQCPSNQTWSFAGGVWSNLTRSSGAPPAREYAAMDYDANLGGLLLFGGEGSNGQLYNDTWLFQGGVWTNVSYVGGGPAPRYGASLAFDPQVEENGSVLYGGCVPATFGVSCFNDTWAWRGGSGWVPLSPSLRPPSVGFAAMAFDAADGYVVLYGGCNGFLCLGLNNETWELSSGEWWLVHPSTFPSARSGAAMAYDPLGRELVLFGGLNSSFAWQGDSWSFSAGSWNLLAPSNAPSPRTDFGLALDPTGTTLLLVGGSTAGPNENDTWAYEVPPAVALSPATTTAETSETLDFTAAVTGGTAPYYLEVSFGDGNVQSVSGAGPMFSVSHSYAVAARYTPSVHENDSNGATAFGSAPSVQVASGPAVTATAHPAQADAGTPISFASNASPVGIPPETFSWLFGDGGTATGGNVTHTYTTAGAYTAEVNLTDSRNVSALATVSVVVVADPAVTVSFAPGHPNTTADVAFRSLVSGGTGPFQYHWRFGNGNSSALPSPTERFADAGTYSVDLWVNDSVGGTAHSSSSVTVTKAASPPPPPGANSTTNTSGTPPVPLWFWGGIGGLAAVAAVGSILLLRRGRSASGR